MKTRSGPASRRASAAPAEAPPEPCLKPVLPLPGAPPPAAREPLRRLQAALNCRRGDHAALLLRNVARPAEKATKRLLASLAQGPTFKLKRACPLLPADTTALLRALDAVDARRPATVVLSLRPGGRRGAWDKGLEALALGVRSRRPDVKLVLALPPQSALKPALAEHIEVRDLRDVPWDLARESQRLRLTAMLEGHGLQVPLTRACALAGDLDGVHLRAVGRYAARLVGRREAARSAAAAASPPRRKRGRGKAAGPAAKRRGRAAAEACPPAWALGAAAASPADDAAELADAVAALRTRPVAGAAARPEADVAQYLVPPLAADDPAVQVASPPPAVEAFVHSVREAVAFRRYVPQARRTLLLFGQPGTGKTLLARHMAAALGLPLLAPPPSALPSMYIAEGGKNVQAFFAAARAYAAGQPTPVMLFFDELDALLARRGGRGHEDSGEHNKVVGAFLAALEGIDEHANDNLVIVGATNLSGTLDPAAASRFGRRIEVPLPSAASLAQQFALRLHGCDHAVTEAERATLARAALGMSGRDVRAVVERAGELAFAATPQRPIGPDDLLQAIRLRASDADTFFVQASLQPPQPEREVDAAVVGAPPALHDFVHRLRHFAHALAVDPRANKTCLLYGPPGTGKTSLVRALAGALRLPLFAPQLGALRSKWHGDSEKGIARLFAEARLYAQARDTDVVLFFDEVDGLAAARGAADAAAPGAAGDGITAALLQQLEGIGADQNARLVVVAATNLPDHLDPALFSRFGTKVEVPLPRRRQLRDIARQHLDDRRSHRCTDAGIDAAFAYADRFSGRDVVHALGRAAALALREMPADGPPVITDALLHAAVRQVGEERQGAGRPPPAHMYS